MSDDLKAFVWFTLGMLIITAGAATVAGWLTVVPGAALAGAGLLRRSR